MLSVIFVMLMSKKIVANLFFSFCKIGGIFIVYYLMSFLTKFYDC